MTVSSKIQDHQSNQNRRKDEIRNTTVQWPAEVRVLREALREMNEQYVEMNPGDPPDTSNSEINARNRAWGRTRVRYLETIQDSLFRWYQLGEFKKSKLPTRRIKHDQRGLIKQADLVLQVDMMEGKGSGHF
ncbi:hypothetical protein BTUL_0032g00010 [Botrytis tulipae]|uniref:Uncharacterized protein n=1 Tax=Botrytis tulipae TaxID=87230 RepID=A0A4Z1EXK7_9HELO|nr:hypothetical protein BTUL_0032g00010 [Botrytis tulipae]